MNENESMEVFAENLKRYTKMSGKSGKVIAESIGVTPATYSYWMSGKKYPRPEKMSTLAEFFHIQVSDLVEERKKNRVDPQTIEARIISVGVDKMTPENREKALNMMRLMFAEIYDESDDRSDDDDTES